tara:strand:+ start:352 stop:603 length:252 start_codon:yes stop_codon:yes gene_type:complete
MAFLSVGCHIKGMAKNTPKRPRDPNQLAKRIIELAAGEAHEEAVDAKRSKAGKKGARARARTLTPEQRSEIASIAAEARWKKR